MAYRTSTPKLQGPVLKKYLDDLSVRELIDLRDFAPNLQHVDIKATERKLNQPSISFALESSKAIKSVVCGFAF